MTTDVNKTNIAFLEVGDEFQPLEIHITSQLNEQCLFAEADFNERYIHESSYGRPLVHPGLLLNLSNFTQSPSYYAPPGTHQMHAGDEVRFVAPAFVDDTFTFTYRVVNVYEKRGRTWHDTEVNVTDQNGRLVLTRVASGALQNSETPISK